LHYTGSHSVKKKTHPDLVVKFMKLENLIYGEVHETCMNLYCHVVRFFPQCMNCPDAA
jgi:hypothetical protein